MADGSLAESPPPATEAERPAARMPGRPPALVLDRVAHAYGALPSVRDVSLDIEVGEVVCLLGPSGCGKTTVLRLAAGLETPAAGRILLNGSLVAEAGRAVPPEERGIGLVFQDIALFPHLDVLDNVAFGLRGPRNGKRARAAEWLARVGLTQRENSWPHMLSGGEQQRVALARALAPGPRLLLMDEPFSSLDPHLRYHLRRRTLALLKQAEVPALIVTHDAEEAMAMADRVAVMREGVLVQTGTPDDIYRRPADLFTARLFGPLNEWRTIVRGGAVATPLGSVPAPGLAEGGAAVAVLRAEGLVSLGPTEGRNVADTVQGIVRRVRWLGADALVEVAPVEAKVQDDRTQLPEGNATVLVIRCRRDEVPHSGASLCLVMDPDLAYAFAEPAGQN